MKKKLSLAMMMLATTLVGAMLCGNVAQAAKFEKGSYTKEYDIPDNDDEDDDDDDDDDDKDDEDPFRYVNIKKIQDGNITFKTGYVGEQGSPIYDTETIKAKIKKGQAKFDWVDSWENKGTGIIKAGDDCVRLKMVVKEAADVSRATLDTKGKFIKLEEDD